ncbi:CHAP domain-containing protein [Epilithonimonas ginsengisoli]|uniref:CHAP domain-containing protein n=1 Tax=Epilithonimonas ginsengisoli TaxID=1245592 RepID=A0ABU4JFP2_9FLAO|nr:MULTISPECIES: CHAP domain-containing protein [Chryseobacterium group]MBV6879860.1 CHAP domain-containing protein [Epilithonimonas sp. FP105]MDW8548500.1 CHAP domain-containing protein [Epilithonimonas ginsengisoli]
MKKKIFAVAVFLIIILSVNWSVKKFNLNQNFEVGQKLDSLNGVVVYYNGGVNNVEERNTTKDGYNLGLKYQCVEFVKRYYYEYFHHKMPDNYGNAKDFFDEKLKDGEKNEKRGLLQFQNSSHLKPQENDLIIFSGSLFNRYGHVAIISKVSDNEIEIIQQNPGPFSPPRETFLLEVKNGKWEIKNNRVLGWLRKEKTEIEPTEKAEPNIFSSKYLEIKDALVDSNNLILSKVGFEKLSKLKTDSTKTDLWECGNPFEWLDRPWMEKTYGKYNEKAGNFSNFNGEITTIYKKGIEYSTNKHIVLFDWAEAESHTFSIPSHHIILDKSTTLKDFRKLFPQLEAEQMSNKDVRFRIPIDKDSDDAFLFYFEDGKLQNFSLWWLLC